MITIPGPKNAIFKTKMDLVLEKNSALSKLQNIRQVLEGEEGASLLKNMSASGAANLQFSPLASAPIERSFSTFKNVLTDCRQSFTEQNLMQTLVVNCFHSGKQ